MRRTPSGNTCVVVADSIDDIAQRIAHSGHRQHDRSIRENRGADCAGVSARLPPAMGGRRYRNGALVRAQLGADPERLLLPDGSTRVTAATGSRGRGGRAVSSSDASAAC